MGLLRILQAGAFGANAIYLIGWVLALIGLALLQDWCKDNIDDSLIESPGGNFSPVAGSDCKKLMRFPWFIWCLCTLPLLLSIIHNVKPKLVPRGTSGLFSVISVLTIIMTNDFYNFSELLEDKEERYAKVTLSGFAILAIGALFTIVIEAGMNPHNDDSGRHGGRHEHKAEPAATTV